MPVVNPNRLIDALVGNISAYHAKSGIPRAELDMSGGIDSAVMAGLLALAITPVNITLAFLGINSNPDALARAQGVAAALGIPLIEFDGTDLFQQYVETARSAMTRAGYASSDIDARIAADSTILGSIRSTMRAPWGRGFNRLAGGGIRHGTGNECEDRWLRFFQKGGDGEVDTNPISMLSKGEVYQLALALGKRFGPAGEAAYARVINATPSADLWGVADKHNDQNEIMQYLGVTGYPVYSSIDSEGNYTSIGLIERVSRFLDQGWERTLFDDTSSAIAIEDVIADALTSEEFAGVRTADIRTLLLRVRHIERITRHKMNPNCPALMFREDLVDAGILNNDLPRV